MKLPFIVTCNYATMHRALYVEPARTKRLQRSLCQQQSECGR